MPSLARSLFVVLSSMPLLFLGALYFFALVATVQLGHYPICSRDDPKSLGLDLLHEMVGLLAPVTLYSVPVWLIFLGVQVIRGLPWRRPTALFLIGWGLIVVQVILDPFQTMCWYAD